jgi:hypothetical protein
VFETRPGYRLSKTNFIVLIVVPPCILISIKLSFQQMHYLLKHKMLQVVFKCFFTQLLHVSVPLDHLQGAHIRTLLKLVSLKYRLKHFVKIVVLVCGNMYWCVATCIGVWQHVLVCGNMYWCVATCILQSAIVTILIKF